MQTILNSDFLQALAYALLKSIWQMGLLWLAIVFVLRIFKLSSAQRFTIAFTAQFCGFILFIYTLIYSYNNPTLLPAFASANTNYINNAAGILKYAMPFVAVFYIIFLTGYIIKLFFNYRLTQNFRSYNLAKMPAENRIFVEELAALFSLRRKVKIYLSKTIKCPLTIGFFKPLILIPLAAVNYLTKEQMEAVIVHELAHIKRADYLLYLLQCIIEKIFFFNIFSGMINDIIERERENACDDIVLQFKYSSFHYAEALLKLGKLQTSYTLAMAASGKKENVLFYRVKRLIHHSEKNITQQYSALRFSFLTLIIALGLIVFFSSKTPGLITVSANPQPAVNTKNDNKNFIEDSQPFIVSSRQKNKNSIALQAKNVSRSLTGKENITAIKKLNRPQQPALTYLEKISPYLVNVNQVVDSVKPISYADALNKQLVLSNDNYKQAISYQNFKQLETMLALTGNSINVTEDPDSKDNYKKLITIETTDKNGNKNIYKVIVELYQ